MTATWPSTRSPVWSTTPATFRLSSLSPRPSRARSGRAAAPAHALVPTRACCGNPSGGSMSRTRSRLTVAPRAMPVPGRPRRRRHPRPSRCLASRCRDGARAQRASGRPARLHVPPHRSADPQRAPGQRRAPGRPEDITEVLGLPVTTMLRTAWDLGRVRSRERAISAHRSDASAARFPLGAFLGGIERFRGERWVTTLRALAPLADGRAESPPESILRLYWIDAGLPSAAAARGLGRRRDDRQARRWPSPHLASPSSTTATSGTRRPSSASPRPRPRRAGGPPGRVRSRGLHEERQTSSVRAGEWRGLGGGTRRRPLLPSALTTRHGDLAPSRRYSQTNDGSTSSRRAVATRHE